MNTDTPRPIRRPVPVSRHTAGLSRAAELVEALAARFGGIDNIDRRYARDCAKVWGSVTVTEVARLLA